MRKKPNRISITLKRDERKECDDHGKNGRTNGKNYKKLNAAATA